MGRLILRDFKIDYIFEGKSCNRGSNNKSHMHINSIMNVEQEDDLNKHTYMIKKGK